jgi:hypothetical protein
MRVHECPAIAAVRPVIVCVTEKPCGALVGHITKVFNIVAAALCPHCNLRKPSPQSMLSHSLTPDAKPQFQHIIAAVCLSDLHTWLATAGLAQWLSLDADEQQRMGSVRGKKPNQAAFLPWGRA